MMYSPSPTTVMKRPLGEWRREEAKSSVEPRSLVWSGMQAPSVSSGEETVSERVARLAENTWWLRV